MHPIAFYLGSLPIRWYGVMMAAAFLAGLWTATRRARLVNVASEIISDVVMWLMLGSIVGARFVYVTTYWNQEFANQPFTEIFMIQHGGLVYYGGLIGATVAGFIYLTVKKLPVWKIADILAPSIALGCVLGRIGCLLNGCCYGYECDLPWAVHYPTDHGTHGSGLHPTQIYDALLNLMLYGVLAWSFRHKKFDGYVFSLYLIGYALFRSLAEHFRGDYPTDHVHAGLTSAQLLSLPILVAGIALMYWCSRASKAKNEDGK